MDTPQVQPAPCPKCGGVRFLDDGDKLGLKYAGEISALYCTACGYVEFYASQSKLDQLARQRTATTPKAAQQQE